MGRHREHGSDRMPETHWSLVADAAVGDPAGRRAALSKLLPLYLPAMRAHLVLRRNLPREAAEDVLQEFLAQKVLESNLLEHADRRLGKFRTFLLTALDRFVFNWVRDRRAGKRMPGGGVAALDDDWECADRELPPPVAFDVAWARQVIDEALRRMRRECDASGRLDVWGLFECRVVAPNLEGQPPPGYGQLVTRFKLSSPSQASNLLVTAKRMFARALQSVVGEYTEDNEEMKEELAELHAILARHGGQAF